MRKIWNILVFLVIICICFFAKDVNAAEESGSGTVNDPYLISTLEQLQSIDSPDIASFTYYKLTQDLDFSQITSWNPITISNVSIDGDNHKLTGLSGSIFNGSKGLFSTANNQVIIKDLHINADLEFTNPNSGILIGVASLGSEVTFENCHISGSITSTSVGVGTFLGNLLGSVNIEDSSIKIDMTTQGNTGGFIGRVANGRDINIENCIAEGSINVTPSGTTNVQTGGIIGNIQSASSVTLKNIFNYLNINSSGNVGCFIGYFPLQTTFISENLYNATLVNNPTYTVYPIGENISTEYANIPMVTAISGGDLNDYQDLLYNNQLVGKKWVIRDSSDSFSITFAPDADLSGLTVFLDSEAVDFVQHENTVSLDFSVDQHKLLFCFSEVGKSNSILYFDFIFQHTPLPFVQLEHDEQTITVVDGQILNRDEMLESNIYYLSFSEMPEGTNVIVKVNGERSFIAAEDNRYLLIIDDNSQIEITFSLENHLPSVFAFSINVIYSLEDLVDTSQGILSVQNNHENPWKRNPEELTRAAFSPSINGTPSSFTVTVSASSGILVFYYKIDNPSSNTSNKLGVFVNGEKEQDFSNPEERDFYTINLHGASEYIISFEVIIGDAEAAFTVQLADIIYSDESEYLFYLDYDTSMGSVTASVDNQVLNIHPAGNIVGVGHGVFLTAEANNGYIFVGWKDEGNNIISTDKVYYFVFKNETALTAVFLENSMVARIMDAGYLSLQAALTAAVPGDIVILLRDYTLEDDIVIPAGVMLLLPCGENDLYGYISTGFNPDGTKQTGYREELYRSLRIDAGVTVSVYGTLLVNAVTGVPNGGHTVQGITGGYAQI
ncbi:MAG: hypothetical protein GX661_06370, partial [Acholeplasmataceae bacterium]|nr:hypothetical protein [Acholeplasmataceae bacterium]